jgi:prophage regulatory protein
MKSPVSSNLVTFPQLRERFGIPFRRQSILRMRRRGTFPEPLRLSEATIAWRVSDIEAWLASRPGADQRPTPPTTPKTKKRSGAATVRRGFATRKKHAAEVRPTS